MSDAVLMIIAQECRAACAGEVNLVARLRKAMGAVASGHWLTIDDDMCLRGAVAGVMLADETTDEDKQRIKTTLLQLRSLAALLSGVPVDIESMANSVAEDKPLPLLKLWHEAKSHDQPRPHHHGPGHWRWAGSVLRALGDDVMDDEKDGGPAFSFPFMEEDSAHGPGGWTAHTGMSLRDYFAAVALTGLLSNEFAVSEIQKAARQTGDTYPEYAAHIAYNVADAMLEARKP